MQVGGPNHGVTPPKQCERDESGDRELGLAEIGVEVGDEARGGGRPREGEEAVGEEAGEGGLACPSASAGGREAGNGMREGEE